MKCIVIIVGVLAVLALAQAKDDAAQAPPSQQGLEPAPPSEQPVADGNEDQLHHEDGYPGGKPPKRFPVGFRIGFHIDTGK